MPDSIYIFFCEENNGVAAVETGGKQMSTGHLQLDRFESAPSIKKKREAKASLFFLVPVTGLEPVRHRWRRILSPLRLPFHHTGKCAQLV